MAEQVLIVGGGDGGTILANSLDRRRFDVTVLAASLAHTFQRGFLDVALRGRRPRLVRDEGRLVGSHVRLVHDRATAIDLNAGVVATAGGARLEYDHLVIATGMTTDPSQIPGLTEVNARFGDYHTDIAQAKKLWAHLDTFNGGTIALGQSSPICKCPPSPVEGILLIDELLRAHGTRERTRLVFFTPYPRPYPAEGINDVVAPILEQRGVEVLPFFDVDKIDPEASTITSIEGDELHYDLPVVIPPFVGADIAYEPGDVVDEGRFVIADKESLRVKGSDTAFAIGDASNLPTSKAGVGAHLQAKVVAKTLAGKRATFDGRTNCSLDVGHGRATYVIGSYQAPVARAAPNRLKYVMEWLLGRFFWMSLKGTIDPVFDIYFKVTKPKASKQQQ